METVQSQQLLIEYHVLPPSSQSRTYLVNDGKVDIALLAEVLGPDDEQSTLLKLALTRTELPFASQRGLPYIINMYPKLVLLYLACAKPLRVSGKRARRAKL